MPTGPDRFDDKLLPARDVSATCATVMLLAALMAWLLG